MKSAIVLACILSCHATADAQTIDKFRIAQATLACGIAPIPPIGCRVGACVCDSTGRNCSWTFVCR